MRTIAAKEVTALFDQEWLCRYPRPLQLVSDQGTQFMSNDFTELLDSYGIKHVPTSTYNPQGNAINERTHSFINNALRISSGTHWPDRLPAIAWSLRTTFHRHLGCAPSEIVFGTLMLDCHSRKDISSLIKAVATREKNNKVKNNDRVNKARIPYSFAIGQQVFIKTINPSKYEHRYIGPFPILDVFPDKNICRIDRTDRGVHETIHFKRLKPCVF
jgi:transposase InsO family protein